MNPAQFTTNSLFALWKPSPAWQQTREVYRLACQVVLAGNLDPVAHWVNRTRSNAAQRAAACARHCEFPLNASTRQRWRHYWRAERQFIKATGQIDP